MNTRSSAILSGVAALAVAVAILGVSMLSGVPIVSTLVSTTQTSNPQSSTTQATGSQVSTAQPAPGTLSVMLTDPPHVPAGVTSVYVKYSDLAVHVSGAGNDSGWTRLSNGGSIDLMSTVNISQTIAAVKVTSGVYNALSLNVTSATVTFNGKNYTAFVVGGYLFVPIAGGGIQVNDSKPSAAIIEISPLVINIGSQSNLEFIVRSSAIAWPVPSGQVTGEMQHAGFRFPLAGMRWWERFSQNATANLQITGASLSSDSLSVSVTAGAQSTTIRLVIVSPLAQAMMGGHWGRIPIGLSTTAVFAVEANGSMVPIRQFVRGNIPAGGDQSLQDIRTGLLSLGYSLTSGSSATFSYTGPIGLGYEIPRMMQAAIVPGQQYLVTVIGADALASQVVVAK
ncbi:MAG TPA: DUF4382 domain-containing protein [Nitrososphaerales archaeon]|nr:DUF4382 domain-containing protein [Nitrososphaerales archaeon]